VERGGRGGKVVEEDGRMWEDKGAWLKGGGKKGEEVGWSEDSFSPSFVSFRYRGLRAQENAMADVEPLTSRRTKSLSVFRSTRSSLLVCSRTSFPSLGGEKNFKSCRRRPTNAGGSLAGNDSFVSLFDWIERASLLLRFRAPTVCRHLLCGT